MPRFTIGIPTYNRAAFLRRAIDCALSQTWPDVEVIVSDNASTDETPEIVRSYGDRVRYHRNETNLGPIANFSLLTDLATGDYFSWLQDDDLIHQDFVSRAVEGMNLAEGISAYTCFSLRTPSPTTVYFPMLVGPAVPLDWMCGGLRLLEGELLVPLSFFYSVANPPALAFQTAVLRRAVRAFDPNCMLFNERIVLVAVGLEGRLAADPWVGAVFSHHPAQEHLKVFREDPGARWRQWIVLANTLCRLLEKIPEEKWLIPFRANLAEVEVEHRRSWLLDNCPSADVWATAHPLAGRIREMVAATLPDVSPAHVEPALVEVPPIDRFKSVVKDLLPPVVTRAISSVRDLL